MRLILSSFLMLIAGICNAQTTQITGEVTDSLTNKSIPYASIFLSNSLISTQTNSEGKFILNVSKTGQYDLIVKVLGYQTFLHPVRVDGKPIMVRARLAEKSLSIKEVVVGADNSRKENLQRFMKYFIGNSEFADQCKVLNLEELWVRYDKQRRVLEASSDEFLIVENKALGYKLKYLLKEFKADYKAGNLFYMGNPLFEDMEGSASQKKKWLKNRERTYLGSSMHFFRSLRESRVEENDFSIRGLIRTRNTERASDSIISVKKKQFWNKPQLADSLRYWQAEERKPRVLQFLVKDSVNVSSTTIPGILALSFSHLLHITYKGKKDYSYSYVIKAKGMINYPVSVIEKKSSAAYFDENGIVVNPRSVIFEGAWVDGVAELLPVDYEPVLKRK